MKLLRLLLIITIFYPMGWKIINVQYLSTNQRTSEVEIDTIEVFYIDNDSNETLRRFGIRSDDSIRFVATNGVTDFQETKQ